MKIPSIPQIYRHVNRWREILAILSKYGLADWLSRLDIEFAKGILKNREGEVLARIGRETRIRMAIEELGPTFIKLGQILSTRPDVVGLELADELKRLQADVPADPGETIRELVTAELGCSIETCFREFDETAMASASIGQVHCAQLLTGEEVVVKVQHAQIEETVRVDLDILSGLAQLAERLPELAIYRPVPMAAEFKRVLYRELDFNRELRNMQQFAKDFAQQPGVHIPIAYPEFSTSRMLTMERIKGIGLEEAERLFQADVDLEEVARRGANLFLEMIFTHGFYHADPHPGNLVILENNVLCLLDFGMTGRLDESMREEIEEMLLAITDRDAHYLTSIITRLGATPRDLNEAALSIDVADFVDHYGNQPMESFDLGGALREMVEVVRRYHITLPAPIAMLIKVLIMLEGTAQLLSPKFSLLEVMQPYRRTMMRRRLSPRRHLKKMRRLYYEAEGLLEILPRRLADILGQVQSGRFDVHLDHRGLEPSVNRLVLGMLTSALFLGSSILLSRGIGPVVYGIPIPGAVGCLISMALALRVLRAISKSGHLDRKE